MEKTGVLYAGKAKTVHTTADADLMILEFRDDTSAFDGEKMEQLDNKGRVNNLFNAFVMKKLQEAGIETHFVELLSDHDALVRNLKMIPVECVVRNRAAGSLVRRLGIDEGQELTPPIFEFFLKNDALHDPMINDYHIATFGLATADQVAQMKELTFKVNTVLQALFATGDLILVDYKLEFGLFHDKVVLGDEFSPDGCRLWDAKTMEKMDKDRFRQGLGSVIESYMEVGRRIGMEF